MEIQIGKEFVMQPTGNIAGWREVKTGEVTKIGRKYFYIGSEKFELGTMRNIHEDCNSKWVLYETMQEYEDKIEKEKLWEKMCKYFTWNNSKSEKTTTLGQLRKINSILENIEKSESKK